MTDLPDPSVREPEGAYWCPACEVQKGQPFRGGADSEWSIAARDGVGLSWCQALPLPPVMVTIPADLLERLANGDRDEFNVHNALERVRLAREDAGRG